MPLTVYILTHRFIRVDAAELMGQVTRLLAATKWDAVSETSFVSESHIQLNRLIQVCAMYAHTHVRICVSECVGRMFYRYIQAHRHTHTREHTHVGHLMAAFSAYM